MSDTYQIDENSFQPVDCERLRNSGQSSHKSKVLLLYGSLRECSFSRLMSEEAALVLSKLGAETKTFNPTGLPLPDDAEPTHPKVTELRNLVSWSEAMVWCSNERHGAYFGKSVAN
jgi:arsenic resistance protein ArsH